MYLTYDLKNTPFVVKKKLRLSSFLLLSVQLLLRLFFNVHGQLVTTDGWKIDKEKEMILSRLKRKTYSYTNDFKI